MGVSGFCLGTALVCRLAWISLKSLEGKFLGDFPRTTLIVEFKSFFPRDSPKFPTQWARRDTLMSRGKNCRETIFVSQLSRGYPHRGGNFERKKCPLLWARDIFGGMLRDNLGEGNCEPKIVARQWGVNFCRETSRCLAGPFGQTSPEVLRPSLGRDFPWPSQRSAPSLWEA